MYVKQCMNVQKKRGGGGSWWGTSQEKTSVFILFNFTSIMLGQMLKSQKFKNDRQKTIFFI